MNRPSRLLYAAPLALLLAGEAAAQTTGTIVGVVTDASTGKPVPGALVVARSAALQGEQTAVTDDGGNYRITLLPPGDYVLTVQTAGFRPAERSDISLRLDKTLRANLALVPEAVQMEEQVVRTGVAPVINVGTAETGTVVTREFVAAVPVGRDFESTTVVSPTARGDTYGVGFAGAQSPENNYVVDGLNVSDPRYGTLGSQLLTNFVEEVDVKTGSFMPEYGRATGGIVNVITKSGSNEFHGSVFGSFTPRSWFEPDGREAGRSGEAVAERSVPGKGAYNADFGFEIGGPILRDRLWFFAGFAPVLEKHVTERFLRSRVPDGAGGFLTDANDEFVMQRLSGFDRTYDFTDRTYQATGKLTYLINENHNLTLSALAAPQEQRGFDVDPATSTTTMNGAETRRVNRRDLSSLDLIGKYAGKFLDKRLILEGVGGWHRQTRKDVPGSVNGIDLAATPMIRWRNVNELALFEAVPQTCVDNPGSCVVNLYQTGGYDFMEDADLSRLSGRVSLSYLVQLLGSHNWKIGVDIERNEYDQTKGYSGGARYDFRNTGIAEGFLISRAYGTVANGSSENLSDVVFAPNGRINTTSVTNTRAYFLQDSWQPISSLTLNFGVRWETQDMRDTLQPNSPRLSIDDNIAPRVQAIWDFTGQGRGKIAANWGRFYSAIPLDMGDRAFGSEAQVNALFDRNCNVGPGGAPVRVEPGNTAINAAALCPVVVGGNGVVTDNFGNSATFGEIGGVSPVAPDIKGMYVDQFGGSVEYEVLSDLSIGFEYAGRRLGRTIEDMSSNDGSSYFIGNPGESRPWTFQFAGQAAPTELNPRVVESHDPLTGRTILVPFPKAKRDYDGFTAKLTKNFSNHWLAQASYTYGVLRGNYSGLFRPENDQLDPNITSEYDLPSLMTNKEGPLPGDLTHQVKLFGAYKFDFGPRFSVQTGAGLTAASGTPVNVLGAHPLYGASEAFIVPRGMGGRSPFTTNVDLRGKLEYVITPPYAVSFTVDVFNVLNSQEALLIDQDYTFDFVTPVVGATCNSKNAASKSNPVAALQADCPQLAFLRTTDGRPVTVNPNWGRAQPISAAFQNPLSVRFGLALSF